MILSSIEFSMESDVAVRTRIALINGRECYYIYKSLYVWIKFPEASGSRTLLEKLAHITEEKKKRKKKSEKKDSNVFFQEYYETRTLISVYRARSVQDPLPFSHSESL